MDLVKRIYISDLNIDKDQTKYQDENQDEYEDPNHINKTNDINSNETKKVIFTGTTTKYQMKKVSNESKNNEKEKKKKVETNTWGLGQQELSIETQLELLKNIYCNNKPDIYSNSSNKKLTNLIVSHIKAKISSYKHQDILKNIFAESYFASFDYVIELLNACNMKCHYCACETYLLYEFVRETKQWSLDRINNDIGHNKDNLVIACLECNLKRRRTNKDAFFMTKNLKITREGL
jgi:hypothetical protein